MRDVFGHSRHERPSRSQINQARYNCSRGDARHHDHDVPPARSHVASVNWNPFAYGGFTMCQSPDSCACTHKAPRSHALGACQCLGAGAAFAVATAKSTSEQ